MVFCLVDYIYFNDYFLIYMKVHYIFTNAVNGGFGVLGKGILNMFQDAIGSQDPIELTGFQMHPYKYIHKKDGTTLDFPIELKPSEELQKDWKHIKDHVSRYYQAVEPDIIFTYGTPDMFDKVKELKTKHKWKNTKHVHYFVWESSKIHPHHARAFKKADLVLTATNYLKVAAKRSGVKSTVWHHGVDGRFQLKDLEKKQEKFVFLHHNAYEYRKGTEILLKAFADEFYLDEPVKLIIKARERKHSVWLTGAFGTFTSEQLAMLRTDPEKFQRTFLKIDHPLVEEVIGHVSDEEMVRINQEANCFVFPAKGEGWGLPPFEAAAMGIVPILPNQGSFKEWFNSECMLDIKIAGYLNSEPRYTGYMFYPSVKDLRKKLRWAFEHQDEIKQMGYKASAYIHANYNWNKIYNELVDILKVNKLWKD